MIIGIDTDKLKFVADSNGELVVTLENLTDSVVKKERRIMLKDKSDEYKKGYKAGYQMGAKFSRKYPCDLTDFNRVRITNDGHYHPSDEFICSNCGMHLEDWCARDEEEELFEFTFRFCPYCGGVIAEERKEENE